jgi:Spy/CpxP family protein refolding chaperone
MVYRLFPQPALLTGTTALWLLTSIGLPLHTVIAQAQSAPLTIAATPRSGVEQLQLTEAQKEKIRKIRSARNRDIAMVLTAAQRTKLAQSLKEGKKLSDAVKELNLNNNQKKRIREIAQKSVQAIRAILTPQQQRTLDILTDGQSSNSPIPTVE